jgi:hypothetical protein
MEKEIENRETKKSGLLMGGISISLLIYQIK